MAKNPSELLGKQVWLRIIGWHGETYVPARVVGTTPKRVHLEALATYSIPSRKYGSRLVNPGDQFLVHPRYVRTQLPPEIAYKMGDVVEPEMGVANG